MEKNLEFTHRRLICFNLFLLSALALFSCSSDDPIEPQPVMPDPTPVQPEKEHTYFLNVTDSLLFEYTEGQKMISVTTDTTYTVDIESDWLAIEILSEGRYIQLNYSANESEEERRAELILKSDAGLQRTVLVKQDFQTRIVSTDYKIGNSLLGEENTAQIKLNRKMKSVSAALLSYWPFDKKTKVDLLSDQQTIEVSGLQGFGSNYPYQFNIEAANGSRHSFSMDIWLSDEHWGIDGMLTGYAFRSTKADHGYAVTGFPDRLYGFNSHSGDPYFSLDLAYTPTGIDYCALTDEVYVLGEDQKLHIYDANDGSHRRDIVMPAMRDYGTYRYVVITDEGWGLLASDRDDRYMFDASRSDALYSLPGFDDWASYREMRPSLGSDGKVWFSTDERQLFRIESANGPVTQPANIDGRFGMPDVWGMGGVWATYVWKPGQNKVLISTYPTAQTVFNFDTKQFDFYSMIESRCEGGLAFDVTQPPSVDRLWWVRKNRFSDGTGKDFLIVENKKIIFWSKDTRNQLSMIQNHPDGKTMIVAFVNDEDNQIRTYFEAFDVEKFNAVSNFSESYAGW